jgi:formylmethanofuran dehydrogenase subunit A
VKDPWRVFLTTDHPNGAPFTSYPHLIRLLMDRSFRRDMLATLHPDAVAMSAVGAIEREYSLYEIAVMTRAAPARILGLSDRGHLGPGAAADIVVYTEHPDRERMFAAPDYVFKDGTLVAQGGRIVQVTRGRVHTVRPAFDRGIEKELESYFDRYQTLGMERFKIGDEELQELSGEPVVHPCAGRASA